MHLPRLRFSFSLSFSLFLSLFLVPFHDKHVFGYRYCMCQGQMTSLGILEMTYVAIHDLVDRLRSC